MFKILVAEDDAELRQLFCRVLTRHGFQPIGAADGVEALQVLERDYIDLIVSDIMMPQLDGFSAIMRIREKRNLPVIVLSAKSEDTDKILGLSMGADDYVTKPYNPQELAARVRSQLRRYTQLGAMQIKETQIAIRGLVLDTESKSVTVDGEAVRLTPLEYKILELLCRHPGKVFSTEEIYRQVWNDDIVSDNAIAVHVRHIREKIEINPKEPRYLKVVWGVGYKIERSE